MSAAREKPVIAVLCCRMGSERFPGKALARIRGKPKLEHVVGRLRKAKCISEIVIATSILPEDDPICRTAVRLEVSLHRGDPLDVVDRIDGALRHFRMGESYVFRAMADQPFLDWESLDEASSIMASRNWDFLLPLSFGEDPVYGAGLSPWTWRAWRAVVAHSRGEEREHAGMWLRRNLKRWDYGLRDLPHWAYRPYRLELDTAADLELVEAIYLAWDGWPDPPPLRWAVSHLDRNPELSRINADVKEKTGTFTSFTRAEIQAWERDYIGREIIWSDVSSLAGSVELREGKEIGYHCEKCGGPLMAVAIVRKKGDLRTKCARCGEQRTFYSIKPKRRSRSRRREFEMSASAI